MSAFDKEYISQKTSLILRDYDTAFLCKDRHFDRISSLRTWTVMSFILIIGADKGFRIFLDVPIITSLILAFFIVLFWFQEVNERINIKRNLNNVREIETIFMDKNPDTYDRKVDLYIFRDLKAKSKEYKIETSNLFSRYFWRKGRMVWYGGLLILALIAPYAIKVI